MLAKQNSSLRLANRRRCLNYIASGIIIYSQLFGVSNLNCWYQHFELSILLI